MLLNHCDDLLLWVATSVLHALLISRECCMLRLSALQQTAGCAAEHAGSAVLPALGVRFQFRRCLSACVQVRSMWRSRRAKWRQLTKVAESVPELGVRLSEFRSALLTDSTFVGCGATWQVPWSAVYPLS